MMAAACCSAEGPHRLGSLDLLMALYVSTRVGKVRHIHLIQLVEFLPAALLKVIKRPCAHLAWKPLHVVVASGFCVATHQLIEKFLAYPTASGHAWQGVHW